MNKQVYQAKIGKVISHKKLSNGFCSDAYEVITDQGAFVLLETKLLPHEKTDYKDYYAILKCLVNNGYKHCPRPIYVSDDGRTLIITKSEGQIISKLTNLTSDKRLTVAQNLTDALVELEKISLGSLQQEFINLGLDSPSPFTEEKDWQTYAIEPFYPYKERAPKDAHTEWIEEQIINFKIQDDADWNNLQFRHGDTTPPNILVNNNLEITLLDWGAAKFYKSAKDKEDFGLAYTFNHSHLMSDLQDQVLDYLVNKKDLNKQKLTSLVDHKQHAIKIADITWAFMMYTKATEGQTKDPAEKFKQILDQRVTEYKARYA